MSIKHFQSFEQINKATQYHFYIKHEKCKTEKKNNLNMIILSSSALRYSYITLGSLPKSHCLSLDLILVWKFQLNTFKVLDWQLNAKNKAI